MGVFAAFAGLSIGSISETHASDPTGESCRVALGGVSFPEETFNALHEAGRGFTVTPLSVVVDGKPKVVFLLGESHVKTKEAREKGLRILRQFKLRGLESVDMEKRYFLGRYLRTILNLMYAGMRKVTGAGSTIRDAADGADLPEGAKPNNVRDPEAWTEAAPQDVPTNAYLEWSNHQPELAEHLASASITGAVTAFALGTAAELAWRINPAAKPVYDALYGANLALAIHQMAGLSMLAVDYFTPLKLMRNSKLARALLPFPSGIVFNRNRTMIRSIEATLKNHPEFDSMLVVVGAMHVKSMADELVEKHGFRREKLPDPVSYLGYDRLSESEAREQVLEIAERRGRIAAYAKVVDGKAKRVVLLNKQPGFGREDVVQDAVAAQFDARAEARFDRRGVSGVRMFNFLTNLFRAGMQIVRGGAQGNPVERAEDAFLAEQAAPEPAAADAAGLAPGESVTIDLAKGYQRGLSDSAQLGMIGLLTGARIAFYGGGAAALTATLGAGAHLAPWHKALLISVYAVGQATKFYLGAEYGLSFKYRDTRWYQRLFPAMSLSLRRRTDTMLANLEAKFVENPDVDEILVTVDPIYAPGLRRRLAEEGFEPAPVAGD